MFVVHKVWWDNKQDQEYQVFGNRICTTWLGVSGLREGEKSKTCADVKSGDEGSRKRLSMWTVETSYVIVIGCVRRI